MKNNNISEEIISGWRREFEDSEYVIKWRYLLTKNQSGEYDQGDTFRLWSGFKMGKTSSHERILEIQGESDNHNKSFLNMFEQNEEKAKRILELEEIIKDLTESKLLTCKECFKIEQLEQREVSDDWFNREIEQLDKRIHDSQEYVLNEDRRNKWLRAIKTWMKK